MTWSDNRSTNEGLHRSSFRSDKPSDLKGVLRRPTEDDFPENSTDTRQHGRQKSHIRLDGPSELNGVLRGGSDSQRQYAQTRPHEQHLELLQMLTDDALTSPDDNSIALKQITNHLEATETKQKLGEIIAQNCRKTAGFIGNRNYTVHRDPLLEDHHQIADKIQRRYEEEAAKQMSLLPNIKTTSRFIDDQQLAAERVKQTSIHDKARNDLNAHPINKIPEQFEDDRRIAAERVRDATFDVKRNNLRPPPINKLPAQFEDDRSFAAERVRNASLVLERNDLRQPPINKIPAQFEDDRSLAARRVRSEYAAKVGFFEKHEYGVAKEFEAVKSQIVDELAKEEANKRNELSREEELDRKRQELLEKKAKKQKRTKNKKSKKNERQEHIGSTVVDVVNATETTVKATEGAIPAPPSSVKPYTVSFNAQRRKVRKNEEVTTEATVRRHFFPAPPSADKPREACYGAVNKNMVFYDPEQDGFVPAPPKTEKPKEGSYDRIRRIKAEVERKASGEVEDSDKAGDGERNKNQTKIRKGSDGLSYLIDINTFRPSTSNRKLERAHAQVVSRQVAPHRHGEPVVMTWNATTAKRGVGFRSKLRKDGDKAVADLKKDGDGG